MGESRFHGSWSSRKPRNWWARRDDDGALLYISPQRFPANTWLMTMPKRRLYDVQRTVFVRDGVVNLTTAQKHADRDHPPLPADVLRRGGCQVCGRVLRSDHRSPNHAVQHGKGGRCAGSWLPMLPLEAPDAR